MALRLRLQRKGRKKNAFYFIVAAHAQSRRDGRFIEKIGTYNPLTVPATIEINRDRALYWIQKGAETTNTVNRILSFKGVLFWKHLLRGVSLGLFDLATVEQKFEKWLIEHAQVVKEKQERHQKHKQELRELVWKESSAKQKSKQEEKNAVAEAEINKITANTTSSEEPSVETADAPPQE